MKVDVLNVVTCGLALVIEYTPIAWVSVFQLRTSRFARIVVEPSWARSTVTPYQEGRVGQRGCYKP